MSASTGLSQTPEPPYYAVIFTAQRTEGDRGYGAMAERMVELASQQPGFLGVDSARSPNGLGITVAYWRDEESIKAWKQHGEHQGAQRAGQKTWYSDYQVRVAKSELTVSRRPPSWS